MKTDNRYVFLGASDAALSMFIEIIASLKGNDFKLRIIKNIQLEQQHPYLVPEIEHEILSDTQWARNDSDKILIGVNKVKNKRLVYRYFEENHGVRFKDYTSLIHRAATSASTANLGHGLIVSPGVVLGPFSQLGKLVTINRNVSVGHHTSIDDFSTIHPGANIAGHCQISEGVTIGMGANVVDGVSIGENSVIGAGSLVVKDVPPNVTAYGVPAKVIKS